MEHYGLYSATFNKHPGDKEFEKCGSTSYLTYYTIEDAKKELESEVERYKIFYNNFDKFKYTFLNDGLKMYIDKGYKIEIIHYKIIEFNSEF